MKFELFWRHVLALSTMFTKMQRIIVAEYVELRKFGVHLTTNVKHTVNK